MKHIRSLGLCHAWWGPACKLVWRLLCIAHLSVCLQTSHPKALRPSAAVFGVGPPPWKTRPASIFKHLCEASPTSGFPLAIHWLPPLPCPCLTTTSTLPLRDSVLSQRISVSILSSKIPHWLPQISPKSRSRHPTGHITTTTARWPSLERMDPSARFGVWCFVCLQLSHAWNVLGLENQLIENVRGQTAET